MIKQKLIVRVKKEELLCSMFLKNSTNDSDRDYKCIKF